MSNHFSTYDEPDTPYDEDGYNSKCDASQTADKLAQDYYVEFKSMISAADDFTANLVVCYIGVYAGNACGVATIILRDCPSLTTLRKLPTPLTDPKFDSLEYRYLHRAIYYALTINPSIASLDSHMVDVSVVTLLIPQRISNENIFT